MLRALLPYLARRLLFAGVLVFLVSSGAFLLTRLAPGDFTSELVGPGVSAETIARERARYGLDRPVFVQYTDWLSGVVRFDLGTSFRYGRPVGDLVGERAANSAVLAVVALLLATLVGIPPRCRGRQPSKRCRRRRHSERVGHRSLVASPADLAALRASRGADRMVPDWRHDIARCRRAGGG